PIACRAAPPNAGAAETGRPRGFTPPKTCRALGRTAAARGLGASIGAAAALAAARRAFLELGQRAADYHPPAHRSRAPTGGGDGHLGDSRPRRSDGLRRSPGGPARRLHR